MIKEEKLATIHELVEMTGIKAQECLDIAQEANALRLKPGDKNIFIDVDMFREHLDETIIEDIKIINGGSYYENNRY